MLVRNQAARDLGPHLHCVPKAIGPTAGGLWEQFLRNRCLHKHSGFDGDQRFIGRFGCELWLPKQWRALISANRA